MSYEDIVSEWFMCKQGESMLIEQVEKDVYDLVQRWCAKVRDAVHEEVTMVDEFSDAQEFLFSNGQKYNISFLNS